MSRLTNVAVATIAASTLALAGLSATGHHGDDRPGQGTATEPAVVTVESGSLLGYNEAGVYAFKGIPYAEAARFEEPQKPAAWDGTRSALAFGEVCPTGADQVSTFEFVTPSGQDLVENENCLNLNVWTKSLKTSAKKPVVVWIHGGGYTNGSSAELPYYDGANLADDGDVVFVSMNQRLNVLGYMDLSAYGPEYARSGNLGMADIVASLEWVRDNITQFGGDPGNVTIVGQSGGAAKVFTLLGMPAASGLFEKAVAASGVGDARPQADAQAQTAAVLAQLGLDASSVDQLKTLPYDTIAAAAAAAEFNAAPVIDGSYYPAPTIAEDGTFTDLAKDVPLMLSTTFSEFNSNIPYPPALGEPENPLGTSYRPSVSDGQVLELLQEQYTTSTDAIVAEFKKAYPKHDLYDLLCIDTFMTGFKTAAADAKANQGGAPVYVAQFAWNLPFFGGITSYHTGGDLPFLLDNVDTVDTLVAGDRAGATKLEKEASGALIRFAYTGNPGSKGAKGATASRPGGLDWPAYTAANGTTMVFDKKSGARPAHAVELQKLIAAAPQP